ncbi:MAG: ribosome biogenesis GTPase YlqF [Planctomycetales bacterium]|nr:ribosome biogenesis GTPase YlqF [Planctomycetales bacterium]
MHKARLEMQAVLPKIHVIIEVLDARIPYSSENPMLAELLGDKPCLKVLTKSDLADESQTDVWRSHFEETAFTRAAAVTKEDVPTIRQLRSLVASMVPNRAGKSINAMIAGIPNVGKSTIINFLAGKKIAKTGNTPAVTKQQQRVSIGDGITLLDTPGVLWPNVHNVNSGYRLALIGTIKETAMDYAEVGFFAARAILEQWPERLVERYGLDSIPTTDLEAIEAIGHRRGCLGKSGVIDIDRASRILVTEIRSGGLGRLTFETPATMKQEKVQTEAAIAQKEETTRQRKQQRKQKFRDQQRTKKISRDME